MHRLRQVVITAFFALSMSAIAAAKDLAVVVNKSNDTKSISTADLTKLFKNGTRKWPAGQDVVIVVHDPNSPSMRVVLQKVLGMTPEQLKAMIATANQGHANASIVIADSDDVALKMVAANAGAIGVVDVYAINSSVNVVKVDGKMPLEPGYLLHGVW